MVKADEAMVDMALMYTVSAVTTSDCVLPQSVSYVVQCGDDGVIRNLDSDEGLSLAACTTIDETTMTCTDSSLYSLPGATIASLVFACEGPTDASREATVTLQEDTLDCSTGVSFGISSYSRTLNVAAVCPPVPGFVSFPMQFENNQCSDGAVPSLIYSCYRSGLCTDNPTPYIEDDGPCVAGTLLESFSLDVTDASSPVWSDCLWRPNDLSSGINNIDDSSTLPDGPLEANYEIVLTALRDVESIYGDTCSFDAPSDISVNCGPDSELVSADLDSTPACNRITPQSFECSMDANDLADAVAQTFQGVSLEVTCRGSTREALALSVDWDPKSMQCTSSSSSFGTELASLTYSMLMWQTCAPFRNYASTIAQQCSPITATSYANLTASDLTYDFAGELCSILHSNCQLSDQCDDVGRQGLGRLQVRVPPGMVDLYCAGGSFDSTNGVVGGEVGAINVPAVQGTNAVGDNIGATGDKFGALGVPAEEASNAAGDNAGTADGEAGTVGMPEEKGTNAAGDNVGAAGGELGDVSNTDTDNPKDLSDILNAENASVCANYSYTSSLVLSFLCILIYL